MCYDILWLVDLPASSAESVFYFTVVGHSCGISKLVSFCHVTLKIQFLSNIGECDNHDPC
jgi:hypothetical protein